ncbi:hypothetical protein [Methanolobus profundi]|uniref:Uncharacterized protein n=1 Tax=Methanolobus profundi TaxID=487685 RepID=A0A1I4REK9_9EURY|nr:hypothetical protein [Methanolobus profundi]SFM50645.1 hypothetical protein SAMN04488696_1529 [Methanolobus profundi]
MDTELSNGKLIRVDIPKDWSMTIIFLFPYIALFILVPLSSRCFACELLKYAVFYLSYIALILQDRTNIGLTQNEMIINRAFFGPRVISKKDIIHTEVKKNFFHTIRYPAYILMIILLIYSINNAYSGIHRAILNDHTTEAMVTLFLSRTLIIVLLGTIFYIMDKRSRTPDVLEISTNDRKYNIYTPDPEEFRTMVNKDTQVNSNGSER